MRQTALILKAINTNLTPKKVLLFGSRALLTLAKLGYDWEIEPDIHLFSEKDFEQKLEQKDLFICEIAKGKTIYAQ